MAGKNASITILLCSIKWKHTEGDCHTGFYNAGFIIGSTNWY